MPIEYSASDSSIFGYGRPKPKHGRLTPNMADTGETFRRAQSTSVIGKSSFYHA